MSVTKGQLTLATPNAITVHIHPVVIFSILDHYKRRAPQSNRVIGSLLGERVDNVVHIKQCFPVPHSEDEDTVAVDMDYYRTMLSLTRQAHRSHQLVGWYSTGHALSFISALIHDAFRAEVTLCDTIHLTVDTLLLNHQMTINTYTAQTFDGIVTEFTPVEAVIDSDESERVGIDALITGVPESNARLDAPSTILDDIETLEHAIMKLADSLDICYNYVTKAVNGEIKGDNDLAEQIHAALCSVPSMDANTFVSTLNTHIQDLTMIMFLANIVKTQTTIADKVNALLT